MAIKLPALEPGQQPVEQLDDYTGYLQERQVELSHIQAGGSSDPSAFQLPAGVPVMGSMDPGQWLDMKQGR